MNKNLLWMTGALWLAAASLMTGCSNDTLLPDEETNPAEKGECFTLYATSGASDDSRLAFGEGEEALTLFWEDGDQLMLVSVNDKVAPIYLTTSLSEPATTAAFQSESAVPAGKYYVKNVGRRGDKSGSESMKVDYQTRFGQWGSLAEYELGEGEFKQISQLDDAIDLYSEPISIADAQTSANITLQHAYAMIKFDLKGIESSDNGLVRIGAICPTKGFVMESQLNPDGSFRPIKQCFKTSFTNDYPNSGLVVGNDEYELGNIENMGALICPVDLTEHKVYFYVSHCKKKMTNEGGGFGPTSPHLEAAYEIVKDGIDLRGGVCYTISLDLNSATKIEIPEDGSLSEPKHFRALAYHYGANDAYRTYKVVNDIDFSEEEYIFPIYVESIYNEIDGGGYTLKNLNISNWPQDNVGLFVSDIKISNLNMENVNIDCPDRSYVGAFVGRASKGALVNCSLVGENTINGKSYVGGLCGGADEWSSTTVDLSGCTVSDETAVTGTGEHIGGLAGYIRYASTCESAATISGNGTYVGGIAGSSTNTISECTFTGNVSGNEYVGGIKGGNNEVYDGSISRCANHGTIVGTNYVGGIVGYGYDKVELSYSIGNVTGETYVGGISGHSNGMKNCYALSNVTGNEGAQTVAGISGSSYNPVEYCYYAGEVSSGYGILGACDYPEDRVKNCVTTESSLAAGTHPDDLNNANRTSILDNVSIINKESVYSTSAENVWENYAGNCPKFLWQIDAMNAGEGSGIKAPAFSTSTW